MTDRLLCSKHECCPSRKQLSACTESAKEPNKATDATYRASLVPETGQPARDEWRLCGEGEMLTRMAWQAKTWLYIGAFLPVIKHGSGVLRSLV
jgi:hypothetical protein